jgi:outer membrane protein OmpA-like peptidoglycan-associated protein
MRPALTALLLLLAPASVAVAQDSGTLVLVATDPYGRPVTATWTLDDGQVIVQEASQAEVFVPAGRYNIAVTATGFFSATVGVEVLPGRRAEAQAMLDASLVTLTDRRIVIHDKVQFETDQAVIRPESHDLLRQVARVMFEHPELLMVSVEGHADSRGSEFYNLELSTRRAAAVKDFLVQQGISPLRLKSAGFGEDRPIVAEENEAAWEQNRRVEFVIERRAD